VPLVEEPSAGAATAAVPAQTTPPVTGPVFLRALFFSPQADRVVAASNTIVLD
jgi:hypothetical protein